MEQVTPAEWKELHPERAREQSRRASKRYRRNNRERLADIQRTYRAEVRRRVLEFFGGKCQYCGFSDVRALQLDHIYGGGTAEWRRLGSSTQVWRRALRHPDDYQLLCANCNWIKWMEELECHSLNRLT